MHVDHQYVVGLRHGRIHALALNVDHPQIQFINQNLFAIK